jgi:hypothetical protein
MRCSFMWTRFCILLKMKRKRTIFFKAIDTGRFIALVERRWRSMLIMISYRTVMMHWYISTLEAAKMLPACETPWNWRLNTLGKHAV